MELLVNGDKIEVPDTIQTVSDLLTHFGIDQKIVIVELNGEILEKDFQKEAKLSDGNKLELVHFVGGG